MLKLFNNVVSIEVGFDGVVFHWWNSSSEALDVDIVEDVGGAGYDSCSWLETDV